jgi:8-oxo-dGTP pyrophosphatase MutT (NUDIX family)
MFNRVFTQTFGVVGAILEQDGKYLLVREGGKFEETGLWNQPAGWLDVGEDPLTAVIREVKEETGYTFKPTGLLGIYSLVKENRRKPDGAMPHAIKLIFCGEITGAPIHSNAEVSELAWFTPIEIMQMTSELRDVDIQQEVADHAAGIRYPLDIVHHSVQ